ncbi:hypothetical protein [Rhodoplanes roseus]|uniref:hypothetical protein n=1 Tax=Rhodoplanes roseus TaxID=29409 RepID=UPI0011B3BCF9|nr:hypothetical protein [Rhodoplanes roseus]
MTNFYWQQYRDWRKIVPIRWLSPGEVLSLDFELCQPETASLIDIKFIEDMAKARDETNAKIKKQLIVSGLIYAFIITNYFSINIDLNISGLSLKYTPGLAELLLLTTNLIASYTIILQGNTYLLDSAIKSALTKVEPQELREVCRFRFFPHEIQGRYQPANLPHIIQPVLTRLIMKSSAITILAMLSVTLVATIFLNIKILYYYLVSNAQFGIWSTVIFVYIISLGFVCLLYFVMTRLKVPYLDYTINHELELLEQVDPRRHRERLREVFGSQNKRRSEMERRGFLRPQN